MRVLIFFDEVDSTVGHFVELCAQATEEFVQDIDIEVICVSSNDLNETRIMEVANQGEDNEAFICVAYSHGSETSLICSVHGDYISESVNFNSFPNTLFYTWACCSAGLGEILVENGCFSYVGYWEPVKIPSPGDYLVDIFVECATYALKVFYLNNLTIEESINAMRDYIEEKCEELIEQGEPLAAAYLLDHSNALDLIGRSDLRKTDIFPE